MEHRQAVPLIAGSRPESPSRKSPAPALDPRMGRAPAKEPGQDGFSEEFDVDDARPLIPEGIYEAACYHATFIELFKFGNARKLFLSFKVYGGEHAGTRLFLAMAAPPQGGKIGVGSKLYQHYLIANGGRPPGRRDRPSMRVFKDKLFRLRVRTVIPRFEDGKPKPTQFRYSVVSELIERIA